MRFERIQNVGRQFSKTKEIIYTNWTELIKSYSFSLVPSKCNFWNIRTFLIEASPCLRNFLPPLYLETIAKYQATTITSLINTKNNRRHIETCRLAVHMSTIYTNQYTNLTFAHHMSLCSSMVRASHRRSKGYGFDSPQGFRKFFWENSLRACVLRT